ncbi:insulinase family protein [Streptomyces mutabilis]|uniref:insulinase family protein n=1 Tax=Streptomyces mutabilis TaxID=67332 RepID=UPI00177CE218|nr:insulinase family protein [Streptomyces mutabilis]GGQ21448.1 hypothetical protein GCM10010279_31580 [Streptomyces mutabilis]
MIGTPDTLDTAAGEAVLHKRTLPNGLRVVLAPHWPTPRTAVAVHYGVGFRSERPGQEGMAHLFEHLMFRGSESLPDGSFWDALHPLAGTANGTTHQDYTDYFQTVPAHALEQALFREADRMRAPRFTTAELSSQLVEVAREIDHMRDGRPYGGFPWPLLPRVMFRAFANAHDGYGDPRLLRRVTVEDCVRFFDAHYAPSNAVLTVVGPHAPDTVWRLVEHHFGDIPARAVAGSPPLDEPERARDRTAHHTDLRARRTAVAVGYRLPDPLAELPAYVTHMVLAELTGRPGEPGSPGPAAAPVAAGCGFFGALDAAAPDALLVTSILPPGRAPEDFTRGLTEWWSGLSDPRAGVRPQTVASAARSLASRHRREHADLQQRCRALGRLELLHGRAELVDEIPELIARVGGDGADRAEGADRIAAAAAALAEAHRAILVVGPAESCPAALTAPSTRPAPAETSAGRDTGASAPTRPTPVGPPASQDTETPEPARQTQTETPAADKDTGQPRPAQPTPADPPASQNTGSLEPVQQTQAETPAGNPTGSPDPVPGPAEPPAGTVTGTAGPARPRAVSAVELGRTPAGPRRMPALGEPVAPAFEGARETTLDSGLRLMAVSDRRAGLVEMRLRVPLGPAGWRDAQTAARLLRAVGRASRATERAAALGGRFHLTTGGQWADISGWAPVGALPGLLGVLADVLDPARLPDAFERSATPPPRLTPEQCMDAALRAHWLARHGRTAAEESATATAVPAALHRALLSPRDAALVLVGDLRPEHALAEAARALAGWTAPAPAPARAPAGSPAGPAGNAPTGTGSHAPDVLVVPQPSGGPAHLTLCAPEPPGTGRDDPARYLATALLGGHLGARLAERCRRLGRAGHVMFAARDVLADLPRALVRVTAPRPALAEAVRDVREEAALLAAVPPAPYSTLEHPRPWDRDALLALVGLTDQAQQRVSSLSGGQRRRLDIALGVVGRPEVLFLDEPTVGFDPEARQEFHALVRDLAVAEHTILLTTHDLQEAQRLADRVLILVGGRIVAHGTVDELAHRIGADAEVTWTMGGTRHRDRTPDVTGFLRRLYEEHGDEVNDVEVRRVILEDVYLSVVRDAEAGRTDEATRRLEGAAR